jgi:hypothetical protein
MSGRLVAIVLIIIAVNQGVGVAQKPVKEEALWIDGSQAPPTVTDMVAGAQIVVVASYTGDERLHPDLRPTSIISSLYKFEIAEVIKSTIGPALKPGGSIEVEMFGGVTELPNETVHTRVHGEERLIPKRRYVLFLNYLPWRSIGNYVRAWGHPGEGIYDISGNRVRPLSTTRREHRGKSAESFLAEIRKSKSN